MSKNKNVCKKVNKGKRITRGERMRRIVQEHTEICNGRNQFVFKNRSGDEYRECVGAYNSSLNRAITHDLVHLLMFFLNIRNDVIDVMLGINQLDDNLMRMMDDREAGRDLISFDYNAVAELIEKMSGIKPENIEDKRIADEIRDLLIMCVMRLSYMAKWANYLETLERIEQFEFDNTIQMFDADGEKQLDELSDKEIENVHTFIRFEKRFLLLYLQAEPDSEVENKAYEDALKMELLAKLVTEGRLDDFFSVHDGVDTHDKK